LAAFGAAQTLKIYSGYLSLKYINTRLEVIMNSSLLTIYRVILMLGSYWNALKERLNKRVFNYLIRRE